MISQSTVISIFNLFFKRMLTVFLFFVSIFSSVTVLPNYISAQTASNLSVKEPYFNFGQVTEGEKLEHVYHVQNSGSVPFSINEVLTNCGCLVVAGEKQEIAPGNQGDIKILFDTTGFSGTEKKNITVLTSDPLASTIMLIFEGRIDPFVTAEPELIDFRNTSLQSVTPLVHNVKLNFATEAYAKMAAVRSQSKKIGISNVRDSGKIKTFDVILKTPLKSGNLSERAIVTLNAKPGFLKSIPVIANVIGPIKLSRNTLLFDNIGRQDVKTGEVKISVNSNLKIKALTVIPDNQNILSEVKTIAEGKDYVVTIKVDGSKFKRNFTSIVDVIAEANDEELRDSFQIVGIKAS